MRAALRGLPPRRSSGPSPESDKRRPDRLCRSGATTRKRLPSRRTTKRRSLSGPVGTREEGAHRVRRVDGEEHGPRRAARGVRHGLGDCRGAECPGRHGSGARGPRAIRPRPAAPERRRSRRRAPARPRLRGDCRPHRGLRARGRAPRAGSRPDRGGHARRARTSGRRPQGRHERSRARRRVGPPSARSRTARSAMTARSSARRDSRDSQSARLARSDWRIESSAIRARTAPVTAQETRSQAGSGRSAGGSGLRVSPFRPATARRPSGARRRGP